MDNLVSVIIPVYNSEKYLEYCVESVLKQTYKKYEIILIDDGSKDASFAIIQKYAEKYPSVVKGITQENKGVAKTRNRGIEMASGEFLVFMDNDDYMDVDYLETMVRQITQRQLDMLVCGCRKVDDKGTVMYEFVLDDSEWSKFRVIAPWARIMRKDFIVEQNILFGDFKLGEDSYFTVTAYNSSRQIGTTTYVGYNWVHRGDSVSNTVQKNGMASPIPFLEALRERNPQAVCVSKEMLDYFVIKFIVWNLAYICDGVTVAELKACEKEYFQWLENTCPDYKTNPYLNIWRLKSEQLYVRILVCLLVKAGKRMRLLLLYVLRLIKR